eukprot:CAMPEP_0198274700 /NCGR_PEP_ID=MMETSP1447-20131203/61426_1 /TAXON_ID=420782 /ORGANISM="Chaetoceros dichaeta, Strain CCMP1751" /LENGTH=431 /DNA_ID=CAMNT_0043969027 /DNA_START=30 /DNA_END=1325 /DNA_ORIENTATION=+
MFARSRLVVSLSALASSTSAFIIPSQARYGVFGKLEEQGYIRTQEISPVVLAGTKPDKGTVQDETLTAPASLLFYDEVLDDSIPEGVVCARGVCVLEDFQDDDSMNDGTSKSVLDRVLGSYLGPRLILAGASILYGTNFPLGSIMNESLTPSAATSSRMVLASLALSPFLFKLSPKLTGSALLCGCFTALGYTSQSLALVDVSPATVAFLGAATVVVCPTLEALIDKKPMGVKEQPQKWLAAFLCISGVGILELYDPTGSGVLDVGFGDVLALLQAVGFGTSFFLTERMMRGQPDQALPITAVQVSVSALVCMIWCISDGWIGQPGTEAYSLPNLFFEPTLTMAAGAVVWTGFITTALNRVGETLSLGKVSSAEASVILATEPLWAALFAALLLSENFGANDFIGGTLIVLACLANTLKPADFSKFWAETD